MNFPMGQGLRRIGFLSFLILSGFACSSSSSSSGATDENLVGAYNDPVSLTVSGATSESCTVYGSLGRELGSGTASSLSYVSGLEEMVIVQCGDLSALMPAGDESVTLSAESTALAESFMGQPLESGSELVLSTIESLQALLADAQFSGGFDLTSFDVSSGSGSAVSDSLLEFMAARNALSTPLTAAEAKAAIIKLLVNSGEAVVIENVGTGQTISSCATGDVSGYSSYAVAANASTLSLSGCLVYHSLDAVTDLNNPAGAPAANVPSSFRTIAKESGVIQELVDAQQGEQLYTLENLKTLIFTNLGYGAYSQDDEGVVSDETIATTDLESFFTDLLADPITSVDFFTAERFHTGYNPSGGWEVNVAAASQSLPSACTDSDRDTVCSVQPLKFNFDGTTLTQNASGNYILRMTFSNGSFFDEAAVINVSTGRPYRDSNYQPVEVAINADDYSAIDYANPLYQASLDPMEDTDGDSAPYSNADWRARYPAMSLVDNAYRFMTPEIAVRLSLLLDTDQNLSRLTGVQAYGLLKLLVRGMAALPVDDGAQNIFIQDHELTLSNWESTVKTWLESGSSVHMLSSGGSIKIQRGVMTIHADQCWKSSTVESCNVTSSVVLDRSSKTSVGGETRYTVTGSFGVSSTSFGAGSFSPTALIVSADDKSARFEGDGDLILSFKGTNMVSKIDGNGNSSYTYSFKVYNEE